MNSADTVIAKRLGELHGDDQPTDRDRRFADQIIVALYRSGYRVVPASDFAPGLSAILQAFYDGARQRKDMYP